MWFKAKMWLLRVVAPIILVIVRGVGKGVVKPILHPGWQ